MTEQQSKKIVKAGGAKGEAVVKALTENPALTRAQLAGQVGCTVSRVGEVIRYLRDHGTKEEQTVIGRHLQAQPARKVAEKTETPKPADKAAKKSAAKPAAQKTTKAAPRKATAKEAAK